VFGGDRHANGDIAHNWPPAHRFEDYVITVDAARLLKGAEVIDR